MNATNSSTINSSKNYRLEMVVVYSEISGISQWPQTISVQIDPTKTLGLHLLANSPPSLTSSWLASGGWTVPSHWPCPLSVHTTESIWSGNLPAAQIVTLIEMSCHDSLVLIVRNTQAPKNLFQSSLKPKWLSLNFFFKIIFLLQKGI